jgi:hypothetical protein
MEILTVGASITVINIKKTWKFADDNTNTGGPLQWNHSEFKYVSNVVSYYKVFSTIHALPFSIIMKYEGTTYIFFEEITTYIVVRPLQNMDTIKPTYIQKIFQRIEKHLAYRWAFRQT